MNDPFTLPALARSAWHDFWRARRALIVFAVLFKLLEAWLLVPAVAVLLSAVLSRAGHVAVSNRDALDFLLSPLGLLYAALFGTVTVALLLLEQAGVLVLAARTDPEERPFVKPTVLPALLKPLRLVQLGGLIVGLLTLALAPFALLALLAYRLLLSEHDINYYLAERPTAFWLAAASGVLLLLGAVA